MPEHRRHSLQDAIDADDPLLLEAICREVCRAGPAITPTGS